MRLEAHPSHPTKAVSYEFTTDTRSQDNKMKLNNFV